MITDLGILLAFHFVFDGLLQSRVMARNKSSNMRYLLGHMTYIMFGILTAGLFFQGMSTKAVFYFALTNTILHGIIDWNIWNVYKYSVLRRFPDAAAGKLTFEYWEDSWFYHFILGDQLLHNLCYLTTYILFEGR